MKNNEKVSLKDVKKNAMERLAKYNNSRGQSITKDRKVEKDR